MANLQSNSWTRCWYFSFIHFLCTWRFCWYQIRKFHFGHLKALTHAFLDVFSASRPSEFAETLSFSLDFLSFFAWVLTFSLEFLGFSECSIQFLKNSMSFPIEQDFLYVFWIFVCKFGILLRFLPFLVNFWWV